MHPDHKCSRNLSALTLTLNRGRGTGTAVLGRRRTPDGKGRGTEAFFQIRPLEGRRRTKDGQKFLKADGGGRRTNPFRPPQDDGR